MVRVLSLGDGMGTGKLAFDHLGVETEYHAVEIKDTTRILADYNLDGIIRNEHDILNISARQMLYDWPVFDWVIFGFTCKSLSSQGNRKNLEGSSKILFNCMDVLAMAKYRNPNVRFLIENVASMSNEMKKEITKIIGVDYTQINSKLVSGQGRDRLYWTNFPVRQPKDRGIICHNELEEDAAELKAWSKSTRYKDPKGKIHSKPAPDRVSYVEERYRNDDKSNTLVTGIGCRGQSTNNIVITRTGDERPLTVRECARLQTIPESYDFSCVSDKVAYDALGNGWTLEVIKHILGHAL